MTRTIDPADVAARFRDEIRAQLEAAAAPLRLVGVLAGDHGPSRTYASYAERACADLGVAFELRHVERLLAEHAIREANADPGVHGVIVYYPVFGSGHDVYLRELVAPAKDVEGMHSTWARALYENRRFIDEAGTKKAILPCTPLAVLKLVEAAAFFRPAGLPLAGRTVTLFNRSEVVGRPLASMMANDGAHVYSFDVEGPILFDPPADGDAAHGVRETAVTRAQALSESDIVVTGVPSRQFPLVHGAELRPGALCINFSTFRNFADDIDGTAACFVPRVGPMTVLMVIRNALRLRENAR
ncbi:MAG: bifunctional methylenetetrahydrofolate dehydrogenase/methenyltetrahydrofolate cyclohydrolase [Vicinamibacteria bacterium]